MKISFRLLSATIALFLATLATARAQFTLVETGGTFRTDATNLAAAANGGTAIGQDQLDYGIHYIANINNGTYGNDSSWIGLTDYDNSWVGIYFTTATNVSSFAFGRDYTGGQITRADWAPYTIQYTIDAVTGQASANNATWVTIGTLNYATNPPTSPELRHLYDLATPLTDVTAFRIYTAAGITFGNAIDEIEVYATPAGGGPAVPEPSTYALIAGLGGLGFVVWRRRHNTLR